MEYTLHASDILGLASLARIEALNDDSVFVAEYEDETQTGEILDLLCENGCHPPSDDFIKTL